MEKNINKKSKKEKLNLKSIFKFYDKNIKKKHLICFIVALILFGIFFTLIINNKKEFKEIIELTNGISRFSNAFKYRIPLALLIVFSGITPFIYVPVFGLIGSSYTLALNICNFNILNMLISSIFGILELFFINLAVAIGIYLCKMYTSKFRYEQKVNFTFADIKQRFLEIKKSKKLEAYKKKRMKAKKEFEKLNVEIDYKNVIILTIISVVFTGIFAFISGV